MSKRKIAIVVSIGFAAAVSAGCGGGGPDAGQGEGQEQFELRFNHVLAESEPFHQGFLDWAEAVEERTDGGLTIEVFPSAQLGVEEDIIEQIQGGANIGQNTDAARLGQYVEDIAVMNGPYFADDLAEVEQLKESETLQGYLDELEEQGLKVLSFNWVQTHRHFFTNKEIDTPEDLSGMRIRTPGSPIWQESVRALGAEPVAMDFGEMYSGIQQGAVDGAELVYANIPGGKLYEVLSHASETGHILLINFEVVSSEWFDSLPTEYQEILVEEADKAGMETSQTMEDQVEDVKADLLDRGMTINEDPDVDAFREAGEAAYERLGLTEVRDQIWSEIGKE
ncbi:C4-dicarboxylate TRAP transporter substrate-binding protein [Antribacter gilvus]|uniref:C4-dicarboxylate TRAP transporter substrate-binding protein n=1 Tax=Antribacter gilvus TaxID=2304675 RepID=UPI000F7A7EEB|nr:C4-dicarboxylate TRAP transporter substrate-binding protein [Antribacter gilvus]